MSLLNLQKLLPKGMEAGELPSTGSVVNRYVRMALPSVLEMVLISLINMADTVMVSGIGTDAVAAVGLVGQPRMIMLCFFFALNVGITAVVARRRGEEDRPEANRVIRNAILIIIGLSIVLMALLLPLAEPLMRFAGAEEGRTLSDSVRYFIILGLALPFNAISMGICAAQRGVGKTKLTMVVNITSNLVNILFNWLLINGIGPFPRLGVTGAAIASDIGLFVGFLLCLFSLFGSKEDEFLHITLRQDWRLNKKSVGDVVKVASSAMIEQIAMRIGFFSYAKIVAGLGTDAFAAHQIAMQFMNLSFSCADGFGVAGTSLVGQMLGRRRKDLAHIFGSMAALFSMTVSFGIALFCVLCRRPLVQLFISEAASPGVQEMAEMCMLVLAAIQPFQMVSVVIAGALRGAGDVRYTARVMALTVAVIRPVLAISGVYFVGKRMGRPEMALVCAWCATLIDMSVRMTLMIKRYRSGKWHNIRV